MGYLQPSNMEQECLKLLNILNVKNHIDIKKIISLTLEKISKTDISVKYILFQVFSHYFKILPKTNTFRTNCLKLNLNMYTIIKYCTILKKL